MKRRWIGMVVLAITIGGSSAAEDKRAEALIKRLTEILQTTTQKGASADVSQRAEIRSLASDLKSVYGTDDRVEYYQGTPNQRKACDSTVALVKTSALTRNADGTYRIDAPPTRVERRWCQDERFGDQPSPAFCSGFVVSPDRIATAGHCIGGSPGDSCKGTSFIFDFHLEQPGSNPLAHIPAANVYECQSVVNGQLGSSNQSDWRVVKVDRPFQNRAPLALRLDSAWIPKDTEITVIGHPVGLPAKIAANATVRDSSSSAFFVANLDTYGGNSGSAVFSTASIRDGKPIVEGILVRGENDFNWSVDEGCYRSKVCPDSGCRGEDITRASELAGTVPLGNSVAAIK